MRFEILYKVGKIIHKSARMYHVNHESLAKDHAEEVRGKVRDTLTGEIVHDACPKTKNKENRNANKKN